LKKELAGTVLSEVAWLQQPYLQAGLDGAGQHVVPANSFFNFLRNPSLTHVILTLSLVLSKICASVRIALSMATVQVDDVNGKQSKSDWRQSGRI
jgi:hypothetical protein